MKRSILEGGTADTWISDTHFDNYGLNAIDILNRPSLRVYGSTFDGTAGSGHGAFHAISANAVSRILLYNSEISNHSYTDFQTGPLPWNTPSGVGASAVSLNGVADCIMRGGFIDYCDVGVENLDGTAPSDFFMYACAKITRCTRGIEMNGDAFTGMVTMDGAKILHCNRPIVGTDLLLNIQPTCDRNNSFISGYIPGAVQPYFSICYSLKTPPTPIPMRFNHWAYWNSASIAQDANPASHMNLTLGSGCSSGVSVNVSSPVTEERVNCSNLNACWHRLAGIGYQEACNVSANTNTVEEQFNQAYAAYLDEEFETAFALFQPLSNMAGPGTSGYSTWCKQYVDVSRAMVDPNGSVQGGGDRSNGQKPENSVFISPNPASDMVEIGLNHGLDSRLKITDSFGKLIFEDICSGNCFIKTADWPSGIYVVEMLESSAKRSRFGKLVVQRL